jgi:outer membrane protein assembly factor BamB
VDAAHGNYENTRIANSEIAADNVEELAIAWTQTLTGAGPYGSFASTPLISKDGVAYVQDLGSNVMAYDLQTGEQLWKVEYNAPTLGPNGLTYEGGLLFAATNGDVFALDAESGKEVWKKKILDYNFGIAEGQNLGFTIQPAVRDGILHLSEAAKSGGGRALAFDAKTGKQPGPSTPRTNPEATPRSPQEHGTRRSSTTRATSTTRSPTATTRRTRRRALRTNASTPTAS